MITICYNGGVLHTNSQQEFKIFLEWSRIFRLLNEPSYVNEYWKYIFCACKVFRALSNCPEWAPDTAPDHYLT